MMFCLAARGVARPASAAASTLLNMYVRQSSVWSALERDCTYCMGGFTRLMVVGPGGLADAGVGCRAIATRAISLPPWAFH